jgi:hypothetical protein
MAYAGAVLAVLVFVLAARATGLADKARQAVTSAQASLAVLANRDLDDEAKEKALQALAKRLFALFFLLLLAGAASLAAPAAAVWLLSRTGLVAFSAVLDATLSWPFLLGNTALAAAAVAWLARRRRDPAATDPASGRETHPFAAAYSPADQALHRLAFAGAGLQATLSDLETTLYGKRIQDIAAERPVFVTALPRGGTTLLLELLHGQEEFGAHTYRQMPFVLTPLFWDAFASRFRRGDPVRERAHGDGVLVNQDSPEALEEPLWLAHWRDHYRPDRIAPWDVDPDPEFTRFLSTHMRKLLAVRRKHGRPAHRYLSKNNLNIARIPLLLNMFPQARIAVPFRDPFQHAASLLRQHENFVRMQEQEPFVREYMAGIGHFDFGHNLRPVDFGGWLGSQRRDPPAEARTLAFWLKYWVQAYERLLADAADGRVLLVDFDGLCAEPEALLLRLGRRLGVEAPDALAAQHCRVRRPRPHDTAPDHVPSELRDRTAALHARLRDQAL